LNIGDISARLTATYTLTTPLRRITPRRGRDEDFFSPAGRHE
jgi:hypothetical protein